MYAIETWDSTCAFGDRIAVERLTLTAPRGAVLGFLGSNGAGKTTTVRMLAALIAPTSGSAVAARYRLGEEDHAIRRNVGLLTESPGLYERLSMRQNLNSLRGSMTSMPPMLKRKQSGTCACLVCGIAATIRWAVSRKECDRN